MPARTPDEAVKELDRAFARRDIEAVLAFYEDSAAVVVEPGRIVRGKEELRKFFTQLFALKGQSAAALDSRH
ncbi:MAG: YybH family protein [Candidatus Binatia bacterium]